MVNRLRYESGQINTAIPLNLAISKLTSGNATDLIKKHSLLMCLNTANEAPKIFDSCSGKFYTAGLCPTFSLQKFTDVVLVDRDDLLLVRYERNKYSSCI